MDWGECLILWVHAGSALAYWISKPIGDVMHKGDRKPAKYGVDAAGAVVWRESDGHVVLVHRPYYDDWSLPKGKCDPGETFRETAIREVAEETGITGELGPHIQDVTYRVPTKDGAGDVLKTVAYFSLKATQIPDFEPNNEVDILAWLPVKDAIIKTSYTGDRDVLAAYAAR